MTTKQLIVSLAAAMTIVAGTAYAGNVDFSIGINLGSPVYAAPSIPVYVPAPVRVQSPPPVVLDEPPRFILPRDLGFRVAVGVPYDLYYVADSYYVCRNNAWYRATSYAGPWMSVRYRALPWELRRYPVAAIRSSRDAAYRRYDDDHDRWGNGRSDREWRNHGRGEHERWQEARRWEHDRRRQWRGSDDD
jgi:hypothetical protein